MVQVVELPQAAMDYVLCGDRRDLIRNYVSNQISNLGTNLTQFGHSVIDGLKNSYAYLSNDALHHSLKSQATKVRGFDQNFFGQVNSFQDLQTTGLALQRFIMAHPSTRQKYLDCEIQGYPETYKNLHGDAVGRDHYDFRRAMSGVAGGLNPISDTVEFYVDELFPGDRELDHHEKASIIHAWEMMDWLYENTRWDFTSEDPVERGD